jgi:hypothetical protein
VSDNVLKLISIGVWAELSTEPRDWFRNEFPPITIRRIVIALRERSRSNDTVIVSKSIRVDTMRK